MLYYIIYFSKAVKLMNDDELLHLLNQSKSYNEKHGITGMLIYLEGRFITKMEGRFMQVLEGDEEQVKEMFDKLKNDNRHDKIIVLEQGPISHRHFNSWTMGFKAMNMEEYREVPGYFEMDDEFLQNNNFRASNTALSFMKSFYKTNRDYDLY